MSTKRSKTKWPNVFKYPDGTYYAFIKPMHGGPAKEFSLRTKKAMQVPDALKIAELKVQRSLFAGSRLTLAETIGDYLAERKKEWKPRTYEVNKYVAEKCLVPHLGKFKIANIDHNVWAEYTKKKLVNDYMNHRSVLRNFLEWCMYKNWIPALPLVFKLPKHTRKPQRILKPQEITAIVAAAHGKIEIFIHLCLFHGLRQNEATVRRFDEINWNEGYLLIADSKTNIPRVIPLLSFTLELLRAAKKNAAGNFIFPKRGNSRQCSERSWFRKQWKTVLKRAGLEGQRITPHNLRATGEKYASKLTEFTRTNREKMFGASVEVQDNTYINEFFVDELRGLEAAMLHTQKGVTGLQKILESKALALGKLWESGGVNVETH